MTNRLHLPDGRQWMPRRGDDVDSTTESWHRGKECGSLGMPPWKDGTDAPYAPPPGWKACNAHPCYLSVAMLPLRCPALSHCSLHAGWPGRPRPCPSNYLCRQAGRVTPLPGHLKTRHPQCSVSERLLKENKHFLDRLLEICLSQYDFNWYLRHLELLEIWVPK